MQHLERIPTRGTDTGRIEALTDGVLAIAMTILVFDFTLPDATRAEDLLAVVAAQWPKFFAYAISFAILGIYWVGQRAQFHFIRRANHTLHWINMLFFACVSLVPFSAKILGRFPLERTSQT